ncbi:MAG: RNA polymerase II C-terminal domain kinase beta subunit [Piccolia ochrophora]|nr:MAG: RNA polymerase II C-terminal domain kinase beta subunit [Piccolia ochrophora]
MSPSRNGPNARNAASEQGPVGPHESYIQVARPYIFERKIHDCLAATGADQVKEDSVRLQGIAWLDSVRKALQLPVRTFNTAAVYYHKFRLVPTDVEYNYIDAAAAALFTACKIEDTLKKSKDILCAAYNLKVSPAEHLTPDDPVFESHAKRIIGLERLMLEASGFDFRNRYPEKLVIKLAKQCRVEQDALGITAYNMSLDLYRTFAPLKQSTPSMAIACMELSAHVHKFDLDTLRDAGGLQYRKWSAQRSQVMETLLDLLDLYTHHRASTLVGPHHPLETFINIRITLNQEASSRTYPRYTVSSSYSKKRRRKQRQGTNGTGAAHRSAGAQQPDTHSPPPPIGSTSATGARATGRVGERGLEGTVRFMLDGERARDEKEVVARFFRVEYEDVEVDVDEEDVGRRWWEVGEG